MAVQLFTILGNHIYIYTYTFTHTYVYTQHGHHQNGDKKEKYTFFTLLNGNHYCKYTVVGSFNAERKKIFIAKDALTNFL